MVKDIIQYDGKEYQLSTVLLEPSNVFETMIFPIEDEVVSGNAVYCYRTTKAGQSMKKHEDVYDHPEKYVSEKAIEKYLACSKCHV